MMGELETEKIPHASPFRAVIANFSGKYKQANHFLEGMKSNILTKKAKKKLHRMGTKYRFLLYSITRCNLRQIYLGLYRQSKIMSEKVEGKRYTALLMLPEYQGKTDVIVQVT